MLISEIFLSFQGEGLLTGVASVFVRASGCNLRCGFCDTPYASWSPEGEELSVDQIVRRAEKLKLKDETFAGNCPDPCLGQNDTAPFPPRPHVVITGGEPMLFPDVVPLSHQLRGQGWHITIETSGTVDQPVACDLMSISPKLSNSTPQGNADWASRHTETRHAPNVIARLIAQYDYQLKFVIDRPEDCREVEAYLAEFPTVERDRVLLMPLGVDAIELAERAAWLEPYCTKQGLRYCPRRHIEWFGSERGK